MTNTNEMTNTTTATTTAAETKIRYAVESGGWNKRRYSAPWIARVASWEVGKAPKLTFGGFIGNDIEGGGAEIMASPGDIIRWGQKDYRRNGTQNRWGIARADGTIVEATEVEAKAAWMAHN